MDTSNIQSDINNVTNDTDNGPGQLSSSLSVSISRLSLPLPPLASINHATSPQV